MDIKRFSNKIKKTKKSRVQIHKNMGRLKREVLAQVNVLHDVEEVSRFVMNDASPMKRSWKLLPNRVLCPLLPVTPEDPPARISQLWEVPRRDTLSANGPLQNTPPSKKRSVVFAPSTGAMVETTKNFQIIDADMELIDFSQSISSTETECSALQNPTTVKLSAGPETLCAGGPLLVPPDAAVPGPSGWRPEVTQTSPTKKNIKVVFTPSSGIIPEETIEGLQTVDADIEFIGFSPSSMSSAGAELFLDPAQATSSAGPGNDGDEQDLECESSAVHPGGDVEVEDEDCPIPPGTSRAVNTAALKFQAPPSELHERVVDRQNDEALQELANNDRLVFDWSEDPNFFKGEREEFTGQAGTTFDCSEMTPFQIFSQIWDSEILELICKETNRYGNNLSSMENLPKFSRFRKWTTMSLEELWTFIVILMIQGIISLPVEREYWKPCWDKVLQLGNFSDMMLFHRFVLIKRCLHFVDNGRNTSDRVRSIATGLTKIQPILDHLNRKFSSLYLPEQEVVIYKCSLLSKERLRSSRLIANKAANLGIKSYELCESRTGYLWQMLVYTSNLWEHTVVDDVWDEVCPDGATAKIVYHLVRPLLNKGHTLVMDKFFNSPLIARVLKLKKTDVMGTIRINQDFVPERLRCKNEFNMRPGEVVYSQTEDLTIATWRDANVVSMISTYHKVEVDAKENRGHLQFKSQIVFDYNQSMGGVDKKDQLLQAFPMERVKNAVWYKKLFRRLLNMSIHNACVMFNSRRRNKMRPRQFRVQLAKEIYERFRPPNISATPKVSHFPNKITGKRIQCKHCQSKGIVRRTNMMCPACNISLCLECFEGFHGF